jgi:acetyl esterase
MFLKKIKESVMKTKYVCLIILLTFVVFSKAVSDSPSWWGWDLTPQEVREKINQYIMSIDTSQPHVSSVIDQEIQSESRTTPIRIYIPTIKNNLPIILLIHGGGWVAGNLDTHDNLARYLSSETQAIVVSVGYLNSPEGKFPLPLEQCYDTLLWIKEHANEFFADASKIAVVGDSAGGNLAAALCLIARDRNGPKLTLQVLINPAPDITCDGTMERKDDAFDSLRWAALQYLQHSGEANNPYVSPAYAKDLRFLPEAVILLAEKDHLYHSGLAYANRLIAAGVPTLIFCQLDIGHLAGHGARASLQARPSLNVAVRALRNAFF